MNKLILLAGAALLLGTAPAMAKPEGKGQTKAHVSGKHKAKMYGYGAGGCPPGLAKKNAMCMPPGQFKKLYASGQRYPAQYGNQWTYNQIPQDLRSQYGFNQDSRYYYGDGYLYQVNPRTMLIQQVVNAIMR